MAYVQRGEATRLHRHDAEPVGDRRRRLPRAARPGRAARARHDDHAAQPVRGAAARRDPRRAQRRRSARRSSRSSWSTSNGTGRTVAEVNRALAAAGMHGPLDLSGRFPALGQSALVCVTEVHTKDDIDRLADAVADGRGGAADEHRHAASHASTRRAWNEPLLHEQTSPRRARLRRRPRPSRRSPAAVGDGVSAIPAGLRRVAAARRCRSSSQPRGAAPLPAALAGDARAGRRHPPRPRHVHDEVQPEGQRGARALAQGHAPAPAGRTTTRRRASSRRCTASSGSSARSRAWTARRFQPGGGTQAVYANARMIRACQAARGQQHRDEIITTVFSHPCDGAGPATAGYRLITLHPGADGLPPLEALKAALSERTAGPDDHEPRGHRALQPAASTSSSTLVHDGRRHLPLRPGERQRHPRHHPRAATPASTSASSTCTRRSRRRTARWACRSASRRVSAELAPYLPTADGGVRRRRATSSTTTGRESIGKVRAFHGVPAPSSAPTPGCSRLGAEGLREVAEIAVLNNNYLAKRLEGVRGLEVSYAEGNERPPARADPLLVAAADRGHRARPTLDLARRTNDFGVAQYFPSHEPWIVAEPMTLEPAETVSRADLDAYAEIIAPRGRGGLRRPGAGAHVTALGRRPLPRPGADGRPGALGPDVARLAAQARVCGWVTAPRASSRASRTCTPRRWS